MNQTLIYEIPYVAESLDIDAQTGAILEEDGWASFSAPFHGKPLGAPENRERLWSLQPTSTGDLGLQRCAVATHNQIYLWTSYLGAMGISSHVKGRRLDLSRGDQHIRLRVRRKADGKSSSAWDRKGDFYIPITAVKKLWPPVRLKNGSDEIVLNLPATVPNSGAIAPGVSASSDRPGSASRRIRRRAGKPHSKSAR